MRTKTTSEALEAWRRPGLGGTRHLSAEDDVLIEAALLRDAQAAMTADEKRDTLDMPANPSQEEWIAEAVDIANECKRMVHSFSDEDRKGAILILAARIRRFATRDAQAVERERGLLRELDTYKRAKDENDERFMLERDVARADTNANGRALVEARAEVAAAFDAAARKVAEWITSSDAALADEYDRGRADQNAHDRPENYAEGHAAGFREAIESAANTVRAIPDAPHAKYVEALLAAHEAIRAINVPPAAGMEAKPVADVAPRSK